MHAFDTLSCDMRVVGMLLITEGLALKARLVFEPATEAAHPAQLCEGPGQDGKAAIDCKTYRGFRQAMQTMSCISSRGMLSYRTKEDGQRPCVVGASSHWYHTLHDRMATVPAGG